jgi:hypothetical protein
MTQAQKYPTLKEVMRDLTIFFKKDQGAQLTLADFTVIAQGRWQYFLENWDFIKNKIQDRISSSFDGPTKTAATSQFVSFSELISGSRSSSSNPLSNPNVLSRYADLLENMFLGDIPLTIFEQQIVEKDIDRISRLSRDDFLSMRERIKIVQDKMADGMGLGDSTYDELYERVGGSQIVAFRFDDFSVLITLIGLMDTVTDLIPMKSVMNQKPDPFLNIRNILNNPSIPMDTYKTGFLVPFPAGATLERLALKYLGNADSWMEIVVANGLKYPYIDEVGERVYLTVNGIGSSVIIPLSSNSDNFAIDDEIFVGSSARALSKRKILKLEKDKNNDQLILTLNGDPDLDNYTVNQRAFVFHYARNTVNSSLFIMIPTKGIDAFPINAQETWFTKSLPQDLKQMGVDLAISIDNDLILDNTGDFKLVYGLSNAAQAAKLKFEVVLGELIRNPNSGMQEIIGKYRNNELTQSIMTTIIESALGGDDRFNGINGLGIVVLNNAVYVNVSLSLAGSSTAMPLTFQLPKGN